MATEYVWKDRKRIIFGLPWSLGTVHCCTADKSTPEFDILRIKNSEQVKDMISDLVEEQRDLKRVSAREFMSEDDVFDEEELHETIKRHPDGVPFCCKGKLLYASRRKAR